MSPLGINAPIKTPRLDFCAKNYALSYIQKMASMTETQTWCAGSWDLLGVAHIGAHILAKEADQFTSAVLHAKAWRMT